MASIGEELRRERQRRGLTIEHVADVLHIKVAYLHALEHDEMNQIPGAVYVKGFIKNYGDFLELDSRRLVDTYKSSIGEPLSIPKRRILVNTKQEKRDTNSREQDLIEPPKKRLSYKGRQERRRQTLLKERILLMLIILVIIAFLGWLFLV